MRVAAVCCLCAVACRPEPIPVDAGADPFPEPSIAFAPRAYDARHVLTPPAIDGLLTDVAWTDARWTEEFVDIEGPLRASPRYRTRAKMVWDDRYFYVAAWLEEPDLWATLTERDAVIYQDNDFEVFIDPDGDTHEYYELEINALGTEWDLFLVRPYRDGGPALHAWDIPGLRTAVGLHGTLNRPGDRDSGWTVEIAFPWSALREAAGRPTPPNPGDRWRVNFSRVQWWLDVEDGAYRKRVDTSGSPLPEANWVWSPQGLINMHYPEMWGFVRFVGAGHMVPEQRDDVLDRGGWALRRLYYAERTYYARFGRYTTDLAALGMTASPNGVPWPPRIDAITAWFSATLVLDADTLTITTDGRAR
ncbi:MAG TPA: carbohydrate-binding family 9-like protein [Gemmatimonadales bacterium]